MSIASASQGAQRRLASFDRAATVRSELTEPNLCFGCLSRLLIEQSRQVPPVSDNANSHSRRALRVEVSALYKLPQTYLLNRQAIGRCRINGCNLHPRRIKTHSKSNLYSTRLRETREAAPCRIGCNFAYE